MFQNRYRGVCIDDIQEEFECSRRTAIRMKSLLFELFGEKFELVQRNDKKKFWRFRQNSINPLISFSTDDFADLEYCKGLSNDENKQKRIEELISKIKALTLQKNLPAIDTDISAIMESERFAVRQYSRVRTNNEYLKQIRNALLMQKQIKVSYFRNNETNEFILEPYGIIISDKYYLVAYSQHSKDFRLYRVDRIKSLEIIDKYFDKDETFSLQDYCNNSFSIYQEPPLNIELEFDKSVAEDVLNYHFHPTQKVKQLDSGNIQVKFKSGGCQAICCELFKWGNVVKIKSPMELKEYYKNYLQEILNSQ